MSFARIIAALFGASALISVAHCTLVDSLPIIYIAEECSSNFTCSENIKNSFCKSSFSENLGIDAGVCQCKPGYISSSNLQRCLFANVLIGNECEESQQCVANEKGRSKCLSGSGICDCLPSYVHSQDSRECLPIINTLAKDQCQDNAQCQLGKPGKHSQCSENGINKEKVCTCKDNAVQGQEGKYADTCLKKAKRFGNSCKIQAQCTSSLKNSFCLEEECVPRSNGVKDAKKKEKSKNKKNKNNKKKPTKPENGVDPESLLQKLDLAEPYIVGDYF